MTASKRKIDVVGQQIGAVYAKSYYAAAEAQGDPLTTIGEMQSLVHDVLDQYPDLEQLLASQMVSVDEKKSIIDRTLASQASPLLLSFLKVLAERERLGYLRWILDELLELHSERQGRIRVHVTTATALDEDGVERLRGLIRRMFSREPDFLTTVDPTLVGGVMLRVGDTVYDGSVAAELERMRTAVQARNSREIEKDREKFQFEASQL